ncbi:MAG: cob(I)yrinic acid a,c-diamide adenosyltransferase [Candidatus Aadella gelida]|nr:cob(I)yrinic acid a,c-diamide adenosyltransferase [Candidatus Aadella gelida]
MRTKGLIQVYTGDGKGKTTAAVGLAVRARARGLKVCFISFHKDTDKRGPGEQAALEELGIDIFSFAKKHPRFHKEINPGEVRRECLEGLEFIMKIFREKKYDVLILDEINISLCDEFVKEEEVLETLDSKPENMELILTGRSATKKIIEKADLVSEIKNVKHPYALGTEGRKGIEY